MRQLLPEAYQDLVRRALTEDVGSGDVTTEATVPIELRAHGVFVAKTRLVLAGQDIAAAVFRQVDPDISVRFTRADGDWCDVGSVIGEVVGSARALLVGERTALNFLQRLSGVATRARIYVEAAAGGITILDTRKTTPGWRALEKYAVACGGATNHRVGLFDAVLIKDNHVRLAGGVRAAIERCRTARPELPLEVEVQTVGELDEALAAGARMILLDNMTTAVIRECVRRTAGRARLEISGGVTLERIPELAGTGADFVSVGALTHSAPAADISFEIEPGE